MSLFRKEDSTSFSLYCLSPTVEALLWRTNSEVDWLDGLGVPHWSTRNVLVTHVHKRAIEIQLIYWPERNPIYPSSIAENIPVALCPYLESMTMVSYVASLKEEECNIEMSDPHSALRLQSANQAPSSGRNYFIFVQCFVNTLRAGFSSTAVLFCRNYLEFSVFCFRFLEYGINVETALISCGESGFPLFLSLCTSSSGFSVGSKVHFSLWVWKYGFSMLPVGLKHRSTLPLLPEYLGYRCLSWILAYIFLN